jgi:predicted amidohydrolase
MPRTVKVAAVQMDAAPAPIANRLERAAELISEAVSAGAQLVVLPEVFNTGYEFSDANYPLAERLDGQTVTWMKALAAQHKVYIAGTLMLLDEEDVFNTALLVAPDGQLWRYDKNFPFLWERAYFREGRSITIADTDFGRLGMMICWDAAHAEMWERYAGKVDAMLVMSCPPKLSSSDLVFPDGTRVNPQELGALWSQIYTDEEHFPGRDMDEHAAWMRVPVVHTAGGGTFRTKLPLPIVSVAGYLVSRPDLWEKLKDSHAAHLEAGFDKQTKVVDANGRVLARVHDEGDGYTIAEIQVADTIPQPLSKQPKMRTSKLVYLLSDVIGAGFVTPLYRRGLRRQWGKRMAPLDPRTKIWGGLAAGAAVIGLVLGRLGRGGK